MNKKNIEAIYPLVPMQQALLWHSLQPGQSNLGFLQMRSTLEGNLDIPLLQQAWERVVSRHATLRTSVHWQELKAPLQVVYKKVSLPWEYQDWRRATTTELPAQLADFLQSDRQKGLNFSQAPVMRLTLIRTAEETYQLIWSCHHLLLDGWSGAIAFKEMLELYEALSQGQELSLKPACTYRDYVKWWQKQDLTAAAEFWREYLKGFTKPTPLPRERLQDRNAGKQENTDEQEIELTEATTTALESLLREKRLTLNALIQGAWALILSSYSGEEDILFGATVSGRSLPLPGVETIVGLLINTLPIRARVAPSQSLLSWLKTLQEQQVVLSKYEHISLKQIQSWSELPRHLSLFRSLLVVENYSGFSSSPSQNRQLQIRDVHSGITSAYPLTVIVTPSSALKITISCDRQYFDAASIPELLSQFRDLLEKFAENPGRLLGELLPSTLPNPASHLSASHRIQQKQKTPYVSPRDSLERQLTQIWENVFNLQPIGVTDNFFDLGGRSLLAAQLFDEISKAFKGNIPLTALFELSTIEKLADTLRQENLLESAQSNHSHQVSKPESPPLKIPNLTSTEVLSLLASTVTKKKLLGQNSLLMLEQAGQDQEKKPLFLIHLPNQSQLTQYLNKEQPIYNLSVWTKVETPTYFIPSVAAHYIKEIRAVQPQGPYILGGYCFGSLVAMEIAQQLQALGQKVALLILIQSSGVDRIYQRYQPLLLRLGYGLWLRLVTNWRIAQRLSFAEQRKYISEKTKLVFSKIQGKSVNHNQQQKNTPANEQNEPPKVSQAYELEVLNSFRLASQNVTYKPYSGKVALFFASEGQARSFLFPKAGWGKLLKGEVEVHLVPGNHTSLLKEPYVEILASKIDICINQSLS